MATLLDRIHFTCRLVAESDLHVGTGETEKLSTRLGVPAPNDPDAADPDVAVIARNHEETPIIPATALKSALRRGLSATSEAARLFGEIKTSTGKGNAGVVWLEAAIHKEAAGDCGDLPHWDATGRRTYIGTHVAITRATRVAEDKKLYSVERVPGGSIFELTGDIFGPRAEAEADLATILRMLADGIVVGSEGRTGAGRLRLTRDPIPCQRHWFDTATAEVKSEPISVARPDASVAGVLPDAVQLTLACPGPYVSLDTTKAVKNRRGPARRSPTSPTLAPSSLLGALRSRCAWLSRTAGPALGLATNQIGDNPFLSATAPDRIGELTATERLFGVNGWRGLVRIVSLKATGGQLTCKPSPADADGVPGAYDLPYTSVALDRFTQGPLDGALFETDYFTGATFAVAIVLDTRGQWPLPADKALFDALLAEIQSNGLMLGHGTNSGFGWFDVTTGSARPAWTDACAFPIAACVSRPDPSRPQAASVASPAGPPRNPSGRTFREIDLGKGKKK